jgi:hypothetical protein
MKEQARKLDTNIDDLKKDFEGFKNLEKFATA